MGFCLISSVSAMDINDSELLSDSNDLSGSSISIISNDISAEDSNLNSVESDNISSSNENSENEVLSTDYAVEDSALEYNLNNKNSKSVLGSSALQSSALQATTKTKTSLVASGSSVYRGNSFSVTLKTSAGKVLANQKVSFKIVGHTYNKTTNSNGVASLGINLVNGKYPVVCSFGGTSAYQASSISLTLSVSAKPTTLKANSTTVMRGTPFSVTLKDYSGKALANENVKIKVGKATYTKTTSSSGTASLTINLYVNKYSIVCTYSGSKNYASSTLSLTLSVVKNPNMFSIKEIENSANNVKAYVSQNKKLPNTVNVGSKTLKISEFSYLASKAINNLNSNNKNDIILLSGISNCGSSSHSLKSTVYKAQYVDLATGVVSTIESKKVPPASATVKNTSNAVVGTADFSLYTFAFAKILAFHRSDKYLPNYCTFESSAVANSVEKNSTILKVNSTSLIRIEGKYSINSSFAGSSVYKESKISSTVSVKNSSSRFYIEDIEAAANALKSYVNSNGKLPSTVTVANTKLSISQFSYLMSKSICNINSNVSIYKYISLPTGISNCNSSGDYISATIYKAQYVDLSKRVVSYIESNKVAPSYGKVCSSSGSSLGNAEFDLYTFAFAKILAFHKSDKYLPNYCTFDSAIVGNAEIPIIVVNGSGKIKYNSSQFKNGLNEKNTETNLTKYLVGTGQSTITSSISNLASRLTKGLSTTDAKALAIYNYVRDEIDYSYYADSRYGASGTLSNGYGNCVDQASLVVALCRASGIHARYAHAQGCTFSSGLVTGHVWAQVLVNGVWYTADATSSRNSMGNIVNWNTNSYNSLNKYAAVPF